MSDTPSSSDLRDAVAKALLAGVKSDPKDTKMLQAAIAYLKQNPPVDKPTKGSPTGILAEYLKQLPDLPNKSAN